VKIIWTDVATFLSQWQQNPAQFAKAAVIVDEGDRLLIREVSHKQTTHWPKRWVLLSALEKEAWESSMNICFFNAKNRVGVYLDARGAFPPERNEVQAKDPEILPADPKLLVEMAVACSKTGPVLFWGCSSTYGAVDGWPTKDLVKVGAALK
jgi:hypothetical protein